MHCDVLWEFFFLYFPFPCGWHSHHWPNFHYSSCFWPFCFSINFHWVHGPTPQNIRFHCLSSLPHNFSPFVDFCCLLDNIRVLGVMFGYVSSSSSFLQSALNKDVHHVKALPILRDVQIVFGILSLCFAKKPSYPLYCLLHLSIFRL